MELYPRIEEALKNAIRAKHDNAKDALRMLLTSIKLKEKEIKRQPNDAEIQQAIASLVRQRHDSIEQFRQGGREELAAKEEEEIRILQEFLPPQLSSEELEEMVAEAVLKAGASLHQRHGASDKILMPETAGRADGKIVTESVRRRLE